MPEKKIPCTVGILTFNSGATLRRALLSVRAFDDVLLCDGGSRDDTLKIAEEFGARVIAQDVQYQNPDGTLKDYSGVRNQCLDAARYDWFLYIDSDETISHELEEEIREVTARPPAYLVYRVPRILMVDGKPIKYSANYPAYQHRFFNRTSGARFGKPVHERIYFDASVPVGTLRAPWHTLDARSDIIHYFSRMRKYRDREVARVGKQGIRQYLRWTLWGGLKTTIVLLARALAIYLRHGFRDTLPVHAEVGRAFSALAVAWRVTLKQIRLRIATLVR